MTTYRTVALVTGGSGVIGGAISRALARDGCHVALTYHKGHERAIRTANEIRSASGAASAHHLDVSDRAEVLRLFDELGSTVGSPSIVVNNAGLIRPNLVARSSDDDWDVPLAVGLTGTYNVTRCALTAMVSVGHGRIVNVGSVAGMSGSIAQVGYSAAKAGLIGLTRTVALETARHGITCNVVAPGFIETAFTAPFREALRKQTPMRRLGAPEEVAEAVAFLVSDRAAFVTGSVMVVGGGVGMGY